MTIRNIPFIVGFYSTFEPFGIGCCSNCFSLFLSLILNPLPLHSFFHTKFSLCLLTLFLSVYSLIFHFICRYLKLKPFFVVCSFLFFTTSSFSLHLLLSLYLSHYFFSLQFSKQDLSSLDTTALLQATIREGLNVQTYMGDGFIFKK